MTMVFVQPSYRACGVDILSCVTCRIFWFASGIKKRHTPQWSTGSDQRLLISESGIWR